MNHRAVKNSAKSDWFVILTERALTILHTHFNLRQHFSSRQRNSILRVAMLQANKQTKLAFVHSLFHF